MRFTITLFIFFSLAGTTLQAQGYEMTEGFGYPFLMTNDSLFGCYWDSELSTTVCDREEIHRPEQESDNLSLFASEVLEMPIDFEFYGESIENIAVMENGYVILNPTNTTLFAIEQNTHLPASLNPDDHAIFAFWSPYQLLAFFSVQTGFSSGAVMQKVTGDAPNRIYYIRWAAVNPELGNNLVHYTLVLHEGTNVIEVVLEGYSKVNGFSPWDSHIPQGTIGVQSKDGDAVEVPPFLDDFDFPIIPTNNQTDFTPDNYYVITFTPTNSTSVSELENKYGISVAPNPATDVVQIKSSTAEDVSTLSYDLYDVTGKSLRKGDLATNQATISVDGLPQGTYFLRLFDRNNPSDYVVEQLFVK